MFPAASLLTTLLIAISVAASPVEVRSPSFSLPLAKRISTDGGAINLVDHDQTRVAALKQRGAALHGGQLNRRASPLANVSNTAISYVASVGVGSPPSYYNLIVDMASSNIWLGADKPYTVTESSFKTHDAVSVHYGTGFFSGTEWQDTITIGGLVTPFQSIGIADKSSGFGSGIDGVIGLGPVGLTVGTLTNRPHVTLPTVIDSLYIAGPGAEEVVGIFIAPSQSANDTNGEIALGVIDNSLCTSDVIYIPITLSSPASNFWGIDQTITYGNDKTILSKTAGIVDTATNLILLASDAYETYKHVTGAKEDATTKMLELSSSQYQNLQNMTFKIGHGTWVLTPNGQIWPRSLNSYIGGRSGAIYSIIGNLGTPSGQGLDFVNGRAFLERFYSVYDTVEQQVGFATTKYTNATTN